MSAGEGETTRASLRAAAIPALDAASGAGASTIPGLADPDTGAMLLDGLDTTGVRLAPVTSPGPLTGPSTGVGAASGPVTALPSASTGLAVPPRTGARPGVVQL